MNSLIPKEATDNESFTGRMFGSSEALTAAGLITRAILATPVKRAGTSGPMLPVMEDPIMSQRWGEGTYNLASPLAYSAAGANGLETVPLPGHINEEQIAHILADVATVAYKDKTPMRPRPKQLSDGWGGDQQHRQLGQFGRQQQRRTARMIRQLRSPGYRIELPDPQNASPAQAQ